MLNLKLKHTNHKYNRFINFLTNASSFIKSNVGALSHVTIVIRSNYVIDPVHFTNSDNNNIRDNNFQDNTNDNYLLDKTNDNTSDNISTSE